MPSQRSVPTPHSSLHPRPLRPRPGLFTLFLLAAVLFPFAGFAQVPEFSIQMADSDYHTLYSRDVFNEDYLPAPLTSHDTTWTGAQIRFKGNSTRYYAKKSYRVRTATSTLYYGQRALNFNSMYTDKSLMREKLSWDLFHDIGALAPTALHANFSINGNPKGLFALIPKVDRYLLTINGHILAPMYDTDDFYSMADLTPQPDSLLKLYYPKEVGSATDYSDLTGLIAALNNAPDGSFGDTVRKYFDTLSVLRWFGVNTLTMMGDSYNKNYLLYRDTSRPAQQWTVIPWDYDLSWGRTGDLAIPYPSSLLNDGFAYTFSPLAGPYNVLKDRWLADPGLSASLRAYVAGLLDTVFTEARLWPRIDSLAALIRSSVEDDPERWGTMLDFDEHVEALKYFVTARRQYLLRTFINPPSGEYDIATLPFSGEGVPHQFVGYDGRLLGTLWFSNVAGLDSITVRVHPGSTPPGVLPPDDLRCVRRWAEVIPYPSGAQFTAKFRWAYHHLSSTESEVGTAVGDERNLRTWVSQAGSWTPLAGKVNSFANTVTIDSITQDETGDGRPFALMLSPTYDRTWNPVANDYWERWHDVRFADSLDGFIVGEHGSFLRTTDGGDSWTRDSIGSALHFFSVDQNAATGTLITTGETGSLFTSPDTGRSWSSSPTVTLKSIRSIAMRGDTGALAGDDGIIYYTSNGGATWLAVYSAQADDHLDVAIGPSYEIVTAGPHVKIHVDGMILPPPGWSAYGPRDSIRLSQLARCVDIAGSTIWVAGDSGLVAFGDISGPPMTERNVPAIVRFNAIAALDSLRVVVVGDGGIIYYTADAGLTWYRQLTGDTHDLEAVAFTPAGRGFAVGNGGTILRTDVPGTLTGVSGGAAGLPSAFRLHQNFPNPFNPSTTIAFDLPVEASVIVEVFDLLGRKVAGPLAADESGATLPVGTHSLRWDATGRPSGVYFAVMRATDRSGRALFRDAKKLLLVR